MIEMLVVMAAMTVILTTAGRLMYQLSRAERSVRETTAIGRGESRLARDFRSDVRAASAAEPFEVDGRRAIRFTTDAGSIEYLTAGDAVRRTEVGRTEAYRLGPTSVTFAVEADRFATLSVEPARPESGVQRSAAGPLTLVARIGADRLGRSSGSPSTPEGDAVAPPAEVPVEAPRPEGGSR